MRAILLLSLAATVGGLAGPVIAGPEVNLYSYRLPRLVQPALDAFTKKTGIEVNVLYLDRGLVERMKTEAENSPADVILAPDIRRLAELEAEGLTQPLQNAALDGEIPSAYRDSDGQWFGLSFIPRAFYVSSQRVKAGPLSYADLAQPVWKGRVCMRDGLHASNIGMISAMIAGEGLAETRQWLEGVKANLARQPSGSDLDQAQAIAGGECDIAIGDSVVLAEQEAQDKGKTSVAGKVAILYPSAKSGGTYVNISGIALARYAPNRDNGVKLMTYLASPEAQRLYADATGEQPIVRGQGADNTEGFEPAAVPLAEALKHRDEAADLVRDTGFNDGPSSK